MAEKAGKNKTRKIILLVILSVLAIFCILFMAIILSKYTPKEKSSIGIIGGADGPTAIFISYKQDGKNVFVYSLGVIILDSIVFIIIKIIGSKKQKSFLKLSLLTIVVINLLMAIVFFPGAAIVLVSLNIIIIAACIIKVLRKK